MLPRAARSSPMSGLLRKLLGGSLAPKAASRQQASTRRPQRFRPQLEALESREVMSVTFHGGPIIPNVQVETLFWGNAWRDTHNAYGMQLDHERMDLSRFF